MANITTQTIRVDLSTGKVIPTAYTHQNDTARTLVFDMYNGGLPYTMTGNTVKFAYKSPIVDGQYSVIAGSSMASGTVSDNKVTVTLPSAYTAISGVGMLTMIITPSSGTIRPVNIRLVVQKSADGDDEIMGASDWPTGLYDYMDEWLAENEPTEIANLKSDIEQIIKNNYTPTKVGNLYQSAYESTYKYFTTANSLRFKGGELVKISNLPSDAHLTVRIDGVNHPQIGQNYYIYNGEEKDIELRLYINDGTININDYLSVYYPKYPYDFDVYGNAVDPLFFPVAISNGLIGKALHRRTAFDLDFYENDVIYITDGYQVNISGTWYSTQYRFTENTHMNTISIRSSDDADIHALNVSDVVTIKHNVPLDIINENYTGVYSLARDVMAEIVIYDNPQSGGAQGITNDEEYIYVFNGNGGIIKINRETKASEIVTISYSGHGNGATYCPDNGHIYVADPDELTIIELSKSFEILNTYIPTNADNQRIGKINGVSFNNIDGKFYCFSYIDGKIYRYSPTFDFEAELSVNFDFTNYQTQGFETDGMYYYIPVQQQDVASMILIFGLDGNEVSRRYNVFYQNEFEDISISNVDDSIYGAYQMHSNGIWYARVVEYNGNMDEWEIIDNIIREKNTNVVFGENSDYPMYKVKTNKLYIKGKVINNNTVRTNCFRLVNCMSPKKRDTQTVNSYTDGVYKNNLFLMGNTSVYTNLTIPVAIDEAGIVNITCVSDSFSPMLPN